MAQRFRRHGRRAGLVHVPSRNRPKRSCLCCRVLPAGRDRGRPEHGPGHVAKDAEWRAICPPQPSGRRVFIRHFYACGAPVAITRCVRAAGIAAAAAHPCCGGVPVGGISGHLHQCRGPDCTGVRRLSGTFQRRNGRAAFGSVAFCRGTPAGCAVAQRFARANHRCADRNRFAGPGRTGGATA